mgnify:CR=1 FL=1
MSVQSLTEVGGSLENYLTNEEKRKLTSLHYDNQIDARSDTPNIEEPFSGTI